MLENDRFHFAAPDFARKRSARGGKPSFVMTVPSF
jgi:hypothetical protein